MSQCSNCFGGCSEIVSDRCVKYTGIDVPVLGIQNGDSLSYVEQALITFLTSVLDGSGIVPIIDEDDICTLVHTYLSECEDITLNNIITVLLKTICDLQRQTTVIVDQLTVLEGNYTIPTCLSTTALAGTHAILQAVITKLCANDTILTALVLNISTNYVALADLNGLIQDYLDTISTTTMMYNRMIPYVAVEYYGPLDYFNASGKGTGVWDKIYLCNGMNGTPDKRGRVGIGCTDMLGTLALDAAVDPANPNNPTYSLTSPGNSTKGGANVITLAQAQMPIHSHTATYTPVVASHTHYTVANGLTDIVLTASTPIAYYHGTETNTNYRLSGTGGTANIGLTSSQVVSITGNPIIANSIPGGGSHSNIQPVLACYYIIFIP